MLQREFSVNVLPFAEFPRNRNPGFLPGTWLLAIQNAMKFSTLNDAVYVYMRIEAFAASDLD